MRRPSASQEMVNSGSRSRMYEELSADLSVSSQTQTTRTHIPAPPPIHQEMSFTAGDDGRARRGSTTNDAHNGTLRDEFTLGSMIMSPRQIVNALRGLLGGGNQSSSDLASAVGGDLNGSSSTNGRPLPASSTSRHKKKTRNVRELLEAPKVNVYSVPPNTYYVRRNPPPTDAAAAALRRSTSVLSIESNAPPRHTVGSRHVRIDEGHNIVSHAPGDGDERRSTAASSATTRRGYQPLRYLSYDGMPTMPLGRLKEKERFRLPPCPPYRIPLYDQACMKYIFGDLFRPGMQLMEFFFVGTMILSMFVNLIMTIVNVFFNQRSGVILPWAKTASIIVFSLEFGVVLVLTIFLVIVVAEGIYTHNVGSRLAHDIAAVVTLAGTFSVLRIVGLASPMFPVRRILPLFQNAINLRDYSLAALFLVLWVFAFFIAFISLIVKVTQIEFTFTTSISEWGIVHLIQLVGLLMNLARVDDSYYKEISVLLDATHRHFCIPGEAREADPTVRLALYSRILRKLGVFQYMYFEYFDVIFNYHVKFYQQQELERRRRKKMDALLAKRTQERETAASDAMAGGTSSTAPRHDTSTIGTVNSHNMGSSSRRLSTTVPVAGPAQDDIAQQVPPEELTFGDHLLIMFNYLSFIFEVDAMQLRRYLQMVQSPLPFYQLGRDSFMSSFMERDHVGMDMALWRNDPVASATQEYALEDPDQFFISFECEDRRDIWDVNYAKNAEMEARKKAQAMAEELLSMAAPSQSQIPQSFVPI